ncbi:MAG: hypothetical protein IPI49_13875 [Myxococcales bacterium]|nr:hypothetical protein [Myxococcales bacterium]
MRLLSIGPDGDYALACDGDTLMRVSGAGDQQWSMEIPRLIDAAVVGEQLWVVAQEGASVQRFDLRGNELAPITPPFALGAGRWMTSPLASAAAWNGARACALRGDGPAGVPEVEVIAPTTDGRWLLWRNGFAVLWRSVGEAWRRSFDDTGATLVSVSTLTDGRMIALCFRRRGSDDLRLAVLGSRDGDILASMRLTSVSRVCIAARRAVALIQIGQKLDVIDLRFGRALRQIYVDPAIDQLLVDDTLQYVATTRHGDPAVRVQPLADLEREAAEAAEAAQDDEEDPARERDRLERAEEEARVRRRQVRGDRGDRGAHGVAAEAPPPARNPRARTAPPHREPSPARTSGLG